MGRLRTPLAGAVLVVLAGCVTPDNSQSASEPPLPTPLEYLAEVRGENDDTLNSAFIEDGIRALEKHDLDVASRSFNRALKFDPTNSSLHFFNGFTYHLMAAEGDASQLDFAKIGYEQALRFNPANAWAAYQRGLIHYREQEFADAQDMFAYAATYMPDNREVLAALQSASYRTQDIGTATVATERLLARFPEDPAGLRNAVVVYGAAGDFVRADSAMNTYAALDIGSSYRRSRLERRLNEWRRVHEEELQLAQSILGSENETEGITPDDSSGFGSDSTSTDSTSSAGAAPKMLLADVAIIRTEETNITNKGFNLLSGLTAQYAGTIISFAPTSTTGSAKSITLSRSHALSIPTVTYNLNIFSDSNDVNEVLARPTLVAIDGEESEFFSGAVWHVELSSSDSDSSDGVQDVPIGIDLKLTPKFIDDETVQLTVTAARAFIETTSSEANFNNFSQTSKTTVTANVVMKFDQTLVMSGLSEKETEIVKTGVPILQDLPIVQYAFSNETTLDLNKSVLILVTPRKAQFTEADGSPKIEPAQPANSGDSGENVKRLEARGDWDFTPAHNLDAVANHLKDHRFYREFRSGDVTLEEWNNLDGLRHKVLQVLDFLYF